MSTSIDSFEKANKWYGPIRDSYEKIVAQSDYFNLLDEIGSNVKETAHTNILMRLLEFHEGNSLPFLRSFYDRFNIRQSTTGACFDKERYYYKTASDLDWLRPGNVNKLLQSGQTDVKYSKTVSRIDGIVFKKGQYAIILENKINRAPEQPGQIDRYVDSVLKDKDIDVNIDQIYVIYLQREDKTVPSSKSLNAHRGKFVKKGDDSSPFSHMILCNYDDIIEWLEQDVLNLLRVKNQDYIIGVNHYISFLRNALGQNSFQQKFQEGLDSILGKIPVDLDKTLKETRSLLTPTEDPTVADELAPLDLSVLQELQEYFIKKKYAEFIDVLAEIGSLEDPLFYITSNEIYMRFWDKNWNGKTNTIFFIWWLSKRVLEFHIEGKIFKENRGLILNEFKKAAVQVECLPRGVKDASSQWGLSVYIGEAGNTNVKDAIHNYAASIETICKIVPGIIKIINKKRPQE